MGCFSKMGRPITCLCGECASCKQRAYMDSHPEQREKARERFRKKGPEYKRQRARYVSEWRDRHPNYNRELVQAKGAWLDEYKSFRGCFICGEERPWRLVFHHLTSKHDELASLRRSAGWDRILAEVPRCIVLCANCHSDVHYNMRVESRSG
jgi:hypothetical protein